MSVVVTKNRELHTMDWKQFNNNWRVKSGRMKRREEGLGFCQKPLKKNCTLEDYFGCSVVAL